MGTSGGIMAHYQQKSTGFALIGKGQSSFYSKDYVIAFRGTVSRSDISTDIRATGSVGDNGSTVHAGFNTLFHTMKGELYAYFNHVRELSTIHCVGHSLGGALASLAADWFKYNFRHDIKLYTFGAPKVGYSNFALKTTNTLKQENIYRCCNGSDPIPMVPVWPFVHAPYNGYEYSFAAGAIMNPFAHKLSRYEKNAKSESWDDYPRKRSFNSYNRVRLKPENSWQASPTMYWYVRLSEALVTLIRDVRIGLLNSIQSGIANGLNLYDQIAMVLSDVSFATPSFNIQINGLLAHMLVFSGLAAVKITELSYEFIRWIFQKTLAVLNRVARQALSL
ncbi:lipase family protein [Thalassomonas viridans]|uniref:lipase family protein n=1 Tax=Thalassomonas viridans TaxID=137584 RepID=UPI001F16DF39|nr:lipase family protein [Thalassomonas viridans]